MSILWNIVILGHFFDDALIISIVFFAIGWNDFAAEGEKHCTLIGWIKQNGYQNCTVMD